MEPISSRSHPPSSFFASPSKNENEASERLKNFFNSLSISGSKKSESLEKIRANSVVLGNISKSADYISMMNSDELLEQQVEEYRGSPEKVLEAWNIGSQMKNNLWNELLSSIKVEDSEQKMNQLKELSYITLLAFRLNLIGEAECSSALRFYDVLSGPVATFKVVPACPETHPFKDIPPHLNIELEHTLENDSEFDSLINSEAKRANSLDPITGKERFIFFKGNRDDNQNYYRCPSTPILQCHLNDIAEHENKNKTGEEDPLAAQIIKCKLGISKRKDMIADLMKDPPIAHFGICIPGYHKEFPHFKINALGWASSIHDFVHASNRARFISKKFLPIIENFDKWSQENPLQKDEIVFSRLNEILPKEGVSSERLKKWIIYTFPSLVVDGYPWMWDSNLSKLLAIWMDMTISRSPGFSFINFANPIKVNQNIEDDKFMEGLCRQIADEYKEKFIT